MLTGQGQQFQLQSSFTGYSDMDDFNYVELIDDGTLDTVLRVNGNTVRLTPEATADMRDPETGELDLEKVLDEVSDIVGVWSMVLKDPT